MIQSLWQIGRPDSKCNFLTCFCLFVCLFCFIYLFVCLFVCLFVFFQQMCQVWVGHKPWSNIKYGTWFYFGVFGWIRYKIKINESTKIKESVAQCVLLCPSYLFLHILTAKFIKTEKKISKKKNNNNNKQKNKLEFGWIKRASQNKCDDNFETYNYFF